MKAKEYLEQVACKDSIINNLIKDKENIIHLMYSLGNSNMKERVQTSKEHDRLGALYAKIDEKEREIVSKIDALVDFRLKVSSEINLLSDSKYITVLYKKYLECKSWKEIATDMNYNIRYVQHLQKEALKDFENVHSKMLETYKI